MNKASKPPSYIDTATGINPFEPKRSYIHPVMKVVRFCVACIKIPSLISTFSISMMYYILAMIIPITKIRVMLIKITSYIFDRLILFLFGNVFIHVVPTPLIDTFNEPGELKKVNPGDIIISNFGSYLNIFWLQSKYSPLYVVPNDTQTVVVYSFFTLIIGILTKTPMKSGKKVKLEKVIQIAKENQSPIVIFPERCPTNGSGLLTFCEFGEKVKLFDTNFHIICFSHQFSGESPNFTCGNGFLHVFRMLGRSMASMKVKIALPQDIPPFESQIDSEWLEKVRIVMGKILRVPLLSVNYESSFEFYETIESQRKSHID
ncbi:hypothetical protein TRFO_34128 [Tritrichomonas foetus]|uniref:Phospholipid/glycerol acyltransferase domain-containing protein n=1 Tax=Tritrichomonas foetus TaxID=1144522 RepID=A0A1J4JJS3_9EUKA|nr:hypothetical protein TRFO_34128 [Tritrichomonas foetus]|eukprot:OHS99408.1 hypothetical protein TRFO_34128 [Tritrichomonas foetus]